MGWRNVKAITLLINSPRINFIECHWCLTNSIGCCDSAVLISYFLLTKHQQQDVHTHNTNEKVRDVVKKSMPDDWEFYCVYVFVSGCSMEISLLPTHFLPAFNLFSCQNNHQMYTRVIEQLVQVNAKLQNTFTKIVFTNSEMQLDEVLPSVSVYSLAWNWTIFFSLEDIANIIENNLSELLLLRIW